MPVFYFDTDNGNEMIHDEHGTELDDEHAARNEASAAMAEMARDYIPKSEPQKNLNIWVRDSDGKPLMHLALTFAIKSLI